MSVAGSSQLPSGGRQPQAVAWNPAGDSNALRRAAEALDSRAASLALVSQSLVRAVARTAAEWEGPAFSAFRACWEGQLMPDLEGMIPQLRTMAEALREMAGQVDLANSAIHGIDVAAGLTLAGTVVLPLLSEVMDPEPALAAGRALDSLASTTRGHARALAAVARALRGVSIVLKQFTVDYTAPFFGQTVLNRLGHIRHNPLHDPRGFARDELLDWRWTDIKSIADNATVGAFFRSGMRFTGMWRMIGSNVPAWLEGHPSRGLAYGPFGVLTGFIGPLYDNLITGHPLNFHVATVSGLFGGVRGTLINAPFWATGIGLKQGWMLTLLGTGLITGPFTIIVSRKLGIDKMLPYLLPPNTPPPTFTRIPAASSLSLPNLGLAGLVLPSSAPWTSGDRWQISMRSHRQG